MALALTASTVLALAQSASAEMNTASKSDSQVAAYCGGPIHPPTSAVSAGKQLDVVGTYKTGLSAQAITNFEARKLVLKLVKCISYTVNTSTAGVPSVGIYASPRQVHLYQGYVVYYLRNTHMFLKVSPKAKGG